VLAAVSLPRVTLLAPRLGFLLFTVSLTGQINALPLVAVCAVLAWPAPGAVAWLLGLAAVLFAFVHWRNRLAGRLLLEAVGLTETRIPLLAGLAPLLTGAANARRISNLRYGESETGNLLDLWITEAALAERPKSETEWRLGPIVDADAHIDPPHDMWQNDLPAHLRELAPRIPEHRHARVLPAVEQPQIAQDDRFDDADALRHGPARCAPDDSRIGLKVVIGEGGLPAALLDD